MFRNLLYVFLALAVAGIVINAGFYVRAAIDAPRTVFSATSGTVLRQAAPVAGARVVRTIHMHGAQQTLDEVVTDVAGRFAFPQADRPFTAWSLLPTEAVIDQTIVVRDGNQETVVFRALRRNFLPLTELGGRDVRLLIDLSMADACHDRDSLGDPAFRGRVCGKFRLPAKGAVE